MRFKIEVRRVQVVAKWVRAEDEERALAIVRSDADSAWGLYGSWRTVEMNAEAVETEHTPGISSGGSPEVSMLLSIPEAATQLGISRATLYKLLGQGAIEHVRIGRRTLISRDALRVFIRSNTRAVD